MNVSLQPSLDGVADERLHAFATRLANPSLTNDDIHELLTRECAWARRTDSLNGQSNAFEASARLLADLRSLKWLVRADHCGIELQSPPHPRFGRRSPEAVSQAKKSVRDELASAVRQQFADPLVRRFISDLETPSKNSRRKSITNLIADGAELAKRLEPARKLGGAARVAALTNVVQPYLQLVPGEGDPTEHDQFTGISLSDIWRYFRFTWSIPQTPIPGRQLLYLIRDRSHPSHAVMGIAALGNTPLISPLRDGVIGWTTERLCERLRTAAQSADGKQEIRALCDYLSRLVADALVEINPRNLVSAEELENPTEEVVNRLQRRADEFASRREAALRELSDAAAAGVPIELQETEQTDYRLPPVSKSVLELEGRRISKDSPEALARRLLVAKKRAFEFSRLLRAKLILDRSVPTLLGEQPIEEMLKSEPFGFAVSTALLAAKSNRIGTNILEITTCGAVSPYSHILGGKLAALLLLSPEVADDYRKRYGHRPSIISSQMKNEERTKDCRLVWLNTTSLYSMGSSQYERVRLPAGVIASDQPELRYEHIGDTEGYGTVQFSEQTVQAVQAALEERQQFKNVNSIFGEGFSPKFRKLRDGMVALGFNPTVLMRHDQTRRAYSVRFWPGAAAFLRSETDEAPSYVRNPAKYRGATARIAQYWRERWLASRIDYGPALESLSAVSRWRLSDFVKDLPMNDRSVKSRPRNPQPTASEPVTLAVNAPDDGIRFWKDLADAGTEACADELSQDDLSRLHVPQPLDEFLIDQVRRGFSVVLTGNAGDGKTHLLRRLEPALKKAGAEVETDATASMSGDGVADLLQRWKRCRRSGKAFCIAANEYPLHLLRHEGKGFAPIDEVERQCQHRLSYSEVESPDEDAREKVLVVDLSLRNPLSHGFAGALLERLVQQPDLLAAAAADPEGDLAWNLGRLGAPSVRARVLDLFSRLAASGHRATIREVWIWLTRALVGSGQDARRPARSPERWYSSRLFETDERFAISALMRQWADPAAHSHPRWDYRLESKRVQSGWLAGDVTPPTRMDGPNFIALKRRFFFEHTCGSEVMDLDGTAGARLIRILREGHSPDSAFKQSVVELINQSYCSQLFPQMSAHLYLWVGHRYHEQPSRGYIANQSVSDSHLTLRRPRLPKRLAGAFDYQPDHLVLEYQRAGETIASLRVDQSLFATLERVRAGLPRQLLPERELNRLDAFVESLRRSDVPKGRQFYIHSLNDRTTIEVALSTSRRSYDLVRLP